MGGLARGKRRREREEGEGEEAWSVSLTFGGPTNPLDPYVVRRMLHETVSLIKEFLMRVGYTLIPFSPSDATIVIGCTESD